ncbi:AMP-binding protein [Antrihabitans sp. YC3-6]|uniref:AMP-binding protein n=1 Tax=Antrihabitans stalagmiti TaxID=2799499 RepID=A0A934U2D1_9NOCA|nr:AMP-binding protein [Antrihabitans stalagmiti]MBJ8338103.1 AMP-binding protein [Antrihabitans stalagmiti]
MTLTAWIEHPVTDRGISFWRDEQWQRFSYAELADGVRRKATQFREAGVRHGEVVPIVIGQSADFVLSFFGLIWMGAVPTVLPAPKALSGTSGYTPFVAGIAGISGVQHFVSEERYSETLTAALGTTDRRVLPLESGWTSCAESGEQRNDGPAIMQFTSGSRGNPKGLCITRENVEANLAMLYEWQTLGDHFGVSWLPLYHDMGLIGGMLTPVTAQAELKMMSPRDFVREPLRWLREYGHERFTVMVMPNFGFEWLVKRVEPQDVRDCDFSSIRSVISGAERVQPSTISQFGALLEPRGFKFTALTPAYGLAEGTLAVTGVPLDQNAVAINLGQTTAPFGRRVEVLLEAEIDGAGSVGAGWMVSCGVPLAGLEMSIRGDDQQELPECVVGEIWVCGASVARQYSTDGGVIDTNRVGDWLCTGDSGFVYNGELYVVGRIGDSIKVRGEVVHMEDLEGQLADVLRPSIFRRSCVVGSNSGDQPVVVVAAEFVVTPAERVAISRILSGIIGNATELRWLQLEPNELPVTTSGKPRRREVWLRHHTAATVDGDQT